MSEALQVKTDNPQLEALERIKSQATPKDVIKWRKGRGGKDYAYANTSYVIRELNNAFAWNWDFECDNEEIIERDGKPFEIKVRGKLTIRAGERVITKMQYGCQPIENGPSIGDCYKGAASDALKKCASMIGIALDLYDSDSPVHKGNGHKSPTQAETAAAERERLAKEKAGLQKAAPKDRYQAVVADTGPSKNLMKKRNHSDAAAAKLDPACRRLVIHGVNGEELLREVNFALASFGKTAVQSRYELDDESALRITESFNHWADSLDEKAKAGV